MERNGLYLSRWLKHFVKDDIIAFFHSILLNVIFIPTEIAKEILNFFNRQNNAQKITEKIDDGTIQTLKDQGFLVCGDDDFNVLRKTREELRADITLESMYLLLTDGCNLRCKYCFEETPYIAKNFKATVMNKEIAKKAVDLFARLVRKYGNKDKKKVIHLYGGEPLLNAEVVKFIIPYIDAMKKNGALPKECATVIVTNGTMITDELADIFRHYGVTVGISLDGPREMNNKYRISANMENVFDKAVDSYRLLKNKQVVVGLSATLTSEVVENFDSVLNFFVDELGIQDGISFNILHYNPAVPVNADYFEKSAKCIIEAFKRFRTLGIYEERIMRKVKAFAGKKPMFADCSVVGSQIVVAPDGRIGVCQDFVKPRTYFNGSVLQDNYDPFESGLFKEWQNRSPFYMEQCLDCEALGVCGGGCPASVELKTGSRWNIDERICFHSKLTLEWLIWETFNKIKNNV